MGVLILLAIVWIVGAIIHSTTKSDNTYRFNYDEAYHDYLADEGEYWSDQYDRYDDY